MSTLFVFANIYHKKGNCDPNKSLDNDSRQDSTLPFIQTLAWVRIGHRSKFRANDSVSLFILAKRITPEEPAAICHLAIVDVEAM